VGYRQWRYFSAMFCELAGKDVAEEIIRKFIPGREYSLVAKRF